MLQILQYFMVDFFLVFMGMSFLSRFFLSVFALFLGQIDFLSIPQIIALSSLNDFVTYLYIVPFFSFFSAISPKSFGSARGLILFLWIVFLSSIMISEFTFWIEFGTRFNFIAVDYLVYTSEVVRNITESYNPIPIVVFLLGFSIVCFSLYKKLQIKAQPANLKFSLLFVLCAVLSFLFYNPAITNISSNQYASELDKNGLYNLFAAFRNNSLDYDQFYAKLPLEEGFNLVKKDLRSDKAGFSIERKIQAKQDSKDYNLVFILVESLSNEFLNQKVDGKLLTPNLAELRGKSLDFTNFYATGTRTVRGLESIMLSMPPTPGSSIVRRPNNENLFSLGTVFDAHGYDLKFIYGGFGYFDNMNYFFENNHFQAIDRNNLDEEIFFANAWGVADEILLNQTLREADKSHQHGKKFFSFVLTTSNHRPYTFPENRIDLPQKTREAAVKYTDYAIGEFLKKASSKPWFDNTIFVITADHCASSSGRTSLPIDKYHIPLLIYAPKILQPQVISNLFSQVDVAPTILGLLSFSYDSKFFGSDMLSGQGGRAFIGTYQKLGFLNKDMALTILSPNHVVEGDNGKTAISYYQVASYLFSKGLMKEGAHDDK